jgi:hypothetical protein
MRECMEVLNMARSGEFAMGYDGGVFVIRRPFGMAWAKSDGPLIYSCSCGPQAIPMGARVADGIQFSDFTVDMLPEAMQLIEQGLAKRDEPAEDFRVGNFWAWHIKKDMEASMYEGRRELIWRAAIIGMNEKEIMPFLHDEQEMQVLRDHWEEMRLAFRTRTGDCPNIPNEILHRLIHGMASAGTLNDIDREIERYKQFAAGGLTELSVRLFDEPMEGLKMLGDHIVPAVR